MNPLEMRIELQDIAKNVIQHPEFQTGKMASALASKVLAFFDPNHVDRKKDSTEKKRLEAVTRSVKSAAESLMIRFS